MLHNREPRVLQRVAACCSVLQRVAACCRVLQCVAVCCSVLQCVAVHMNVSCYTTVNRVAYITHPLHTPITHAPILSSSQSLAVSDHPPPPTPPPSNTPPTPTHWVGFRRR